MSTRRVRVDAALVQRGLADNAAAAKKFIESKNKKQAGPPREVYITDPGIEKDTAKWLTEIIFPVE